MTKKILYHKLRKKKLIHLVISKIIRITMTSLRIWRKRNKINIKKNKIIKIINHMLLLINSWICQIKICLKVFVFLMILKFKKLLWKVSEFQIIILITKYKIQSKKSLKKLNKKNLKK